MLFLIKFQNHNNALYNSVQTDNFYEPNSGRPHAHDIVSNKGGNQMHHNNNENSFMFESPGGFDNDETYDRNYLLNNSRGGGKGGINQD